MSYQPLWVNGKTVGPDRRNSAGRYEAIADCVRHLLNPGFSALDVGAQSGYFAVRLQQDFDALVTAVDGAPELMEGLAAMPNHAVVGLGKFLTPEDLLSFRPVDVTLCLSVLHHVSWWDVMMDGLMGMSRMMFVECAMPEEEIGKDPDLLAEQHDFVRSLSGSMRVGYAPGYDDRVMRPMYLLPGRVKA